MSISKNRWSDLFRFKGVSRWITIIVITLGISSFLGLELPRYTADLARSYGSPQFGVTLKVLLFLFVGIYLNRVAYQYAINRFVYGVMNHLRLSCYRSWILTHEGMDESKREKALKEKFPLGEVLARVMTDTESIRELVTSGSFGIIIDLFFVVSSLISFIGLNLISGVSLSVFEIGALGVLLWGSRGLRDVFMAVRTSRGKLSRAVADVVGGLKESYYSNHSGYGSQKTNIASEDFLKTQLRYNFWDAGYYSVAESLYPLLLAFVFLISPYSKLTEAAIVFALVDLIQRSINPLKEISGKIANIQRAQSGVVRIAEFLDALNPSQEDGLSPGFSFDRLKVKINSFEYPNLEGEEAFAIKDVEFEGKSGELIGIVGLSGSGKSTVLNIIAANILPTHMNIRLVSNDAKEIPLDHDVKIQAKYRRQVGIVSQDSHLFSTSLAFNLTFEDEIKPDLETFWQEATVMIPYLKRWGITLSTQVKVNELSMGQKQLLAGLRACYLNKPVVLFDEISSGLDSELEEALRKLVLMIQRKALTIIVAHRLETIKSADKIIVMDKGRLSSSGNHQELMNSSSIYCQFIRELSPS